MPQPKKRIVVCFDGTWNDPENATPTNVLRMARAIRPEDGNGVQQVVFYDWGVGTYHQTIRGGIAGLGIQKNIQDGYRFIVQNYDEGDSLFLFGFSRGAYTARALAGMLNCCGILTRDRAHEIPAAFDFYKNKNAKPSSSEAKTWREKHTYGAGRGLVDFIGVWDTVGALGIPNRVLAFVEQQDLFFDVVLGSNVAVARHAVSIDEMRADFRPTLWGPKDSVDIQQVWFAGVHSDVGGGYEPRDGMQLSDIPLDWMAKEAAKNGLLFEPHLVGPVDGLHLASAHRSYKGFFRVLGRERREIPTNAVLHASVKQRFEGCDYTPDNVVDWLERRGGTWKVTL
jgi:uncharacterized protein (DUF2235 family)